MDNKKRTILTFVTGFGMWVVFGAISALLIYFVQRSNLHNKDLRLMLPFLIPIAVMALPFAMAAAGSGITFSSGSSRALSLKSMEDMFKLMILISLAVSGVGWIPMGYWTGKSLLNWLEKNTISDMWEQLGAFGAGCGCIVLGALLFYSMFAIPAGLQDVNNVSGLRGIAIGLSVFWGLVILTGLVRYVLKHAKKQH